VCQVGWAASSSWMMMLNEVMPSLQLPLEGRHAKQHGHSQE
jgi:hypothetical protein